MERSQPGREQHLDKNTEPPESIMDLMMMLLMIMVMVAMMVMLIIIMVVVMLRMAVAARKGAAGWEPPIWHVGQWC